jgi:hypothetical protein
MGNVRTDPSGTEVSERLQEIEGALHVALSALERLDVAARQSPHQAALVSKKPAAL